jgi:hypothetical protein
MNLGALAASGEILLFLHGDSRLPPGFDVMVRKTTLKPGFVAGAFELGINAPFWGFRLIEWGVKWRSRFWQMPYGDQAIFLPKVLFAEVGNFPELPIMEDFKLMQCLKSLGRIAIVPVPVITSARRWLNKGIITTTLINQIVVIGYLWGVSPENLDFWYRQRKFPKI